MRQDSTQAEGSRRARLRLRRWRAPGSPTARVLLPKIAPLGARLNVARPRIALGPVAGRIALASLDVGDVRWSCCSRPPRRSPLVPHSGIAFPGWEAGPLHGLLGLTVRSNYAVSMGFSVVLVAMLLAYGVAVLAVARRCRCARSRSGSSRCT